MRAATELAAVGLRNVQAHEMFERSAMARPEAVALVYGSARLSYGELNEQANRLARRLRALGARTETIVGICLDRPPEFVLAELAVLKAGAAFVPLDPEYPAERLESMMRDSAAKIVIHRGRPPASGAVGVNLDTTSDLATGPGGSDLGVPVPDGALAYVIYTSGSTGRPKGVQVEHGQLAAMLGDGPGMLALGQTSRCLQSISFAFDMSVGLTFATLVAGGALILTDAADAARPDQLARLLREQGADVVTLPPSVLASLREADLAGVRTVCAGGEACPVNLARRLRPAQRFVNAYGPTETTVVATAHISAPSDASSDVVPIGTALPFARVYVLDEAHEPVPAGEVGEIYIGGAGVTRGYLGMPGTTADRFVPDPRAVTAGARMYRTGDLGRVLDDGELEFRGRTDHQVKIHGYRIELTEVERALEAHPGVAQAAVLVHESQAAGTQLHGYVVCAGADQVTDLREFLAERLPRYLIPHALVPVAAFPLTSNGKVDRAALAQTDATATARPRAYVPASGSSEEAIARIWAQVLRVPQVGRLDNFTELGGDSLAAGKIAERIRGALGVDLPLRVFFDDAVTVGGLAAAVDSGEFTASSNPVARIPRRVRPS